MTIRSTGIRPIERNGLKGFGLTLTIHPDQPGRSSLPADSAPEAGSSSMVSGVTHSKFRAKASEDNGRITGGAGPVAGEVSRVDAGRTASATSERMDVTAGETALNSNPRLSSPDAANCERIAQAAGASPSYSEWQPIDSAPRDGECILIWKPDERRVGEYMMAAYWDHEKDGFVPVGGTHKQGYFSEWAGCNQGYPTHWLPLPNPPKKEG